MHPKIKQENHSGGHEAIAKQGIDTNRTPHREGPDGSFGYWVLDASGYCGLGGKP